MLTLKRILVPTDFTDASERAIEYALELARGFGATVVILHAYEIPIVGFPDGVLIASPTLATQIETAAHDGLKAAVDRHVGGDVHIESVLRDGPADRVVNTVAEEMNIDLIVLGTHGRRGIAHAILGSVAEKIVRAATRPVLTLHDPPVKKAA